MKTTIGLERCVSFINANVGDAPAHSYLGSVAQRPWFITLSRQAGCNAHAVAARVAELLQTRDPRATPPWTVFDRNLVEEVLRDHHLPQRLREHMPEDRHTELQDIMGEIFDLHPSSWTLVHQTIDTVLRLADRGRCILIGRAANLVTRKVARGLHVRLIGSLETRVQQMQHYEQLDPKAARARVLEQDRARARYVKKYFEVDVEAAEHYHLVLNEDCFSSEQAAQMIVQALTVLMPPAARD
jgi:cytidylate kinase